MNVRRASGAASSRIVGLASPLSDEHSILHKGFSLFTKIDRTYCNSALDICSTGDPDAFGEHRSDKYAWGLCTSNVSTV